MAISSELSGVRKRRIHPRSYRPPRRIPGSHRGGVPASISRTLLPGEALLALDAFARSLRPTRDPVGWPATAPGDAIAKAVLNDLMLEGSAHAGGLAPDGVVTHLFAGRESGSRGGNRGGCLRESRPLLVRFRAASDQNERNTQRKTSHRSHQHLLRDRPRTRSQPRVIVFSRGSGSAFRWRLHDSRSVRLRCGRTTQTRLRPHPSFRQCR